MNLSTDHLGEIFILSKLFSGSEIVLSASSKNAEKELIAIYLRSGNFIYYSLTEDNPVIKQIPWFSDSHHTPVSIHFSPSGDSLLVLSISCNLYIIPAFSLLDAKFKNEYCFSQNDITILTFPFILKTAKTKTNSKLPNSNFGILSSSSSLKLSEKEKNFHFNCSGLVSDFQANEIVTKFKDISDEACDLFPTSVCWWQSAYSSKEVGVIGTKSGDIIFVDLFTGLKIGETSVKGEVKRLSVCQDNIIENVFLLITVENEEQYKLILEQRHLNYVWPGKQKSNGSEDHDLSDNTNASSGNGNGNGAPSTRARLQGLKQMSAEKLAMLKNKIAETRAKIAVKQEIIGEVSGSDKLCGPPPENLGSLFGDTLLSPQYLNEENVLVGYYTHSQLLTVHSMNLDLTPLTVHKMPIGAEEILVCERVIYVVSNNRTSLSVISAKLSETWIESSTEFDPDWVVAKWNLNILEGKTKENLQYLEVNEGKKLFAKPDLIPENYSNDNEEKIISVYKSSGNFENFDIAKTYKLDTNKNEIPDFPKIENCIVITNKHVYVVELKSNIIKVVLDTILEAHNLEKAERICTIFGISLQKLLELAGDIKLATLDFTMAIAFYKLSKCGLLKSIVKLACGNHCSQVLNYSTMLMTNSISDMSLTERIHLSNIVLMSYSEQILKNENNRNLLEKFFEKCRRKRRGFLTEMPKRALKVAIDIYCLSVSIEHREFLQTNSYFDEVLAVSVTGQSLLFPCLHKLITCKGLILDGYNILIKLMTRFLKSKILERTLNKIEFWRCATSVDLVEAMIVKSSWFLVYVNYVSQNLDELEPALLERLLKVLDPTAACVRPISRFFKTSDESFDNDDTQAGFPFAKLVELFLVTLLVKLHKEKNDEETYCRDLIKPMQETNDDGEGFAVLNEVENFGSGETLSDEIWPIRKDIQVVGDKKSVMRTETCLSCGYGHTALIRNGNVYTWGHTAKGCLGQGPTMSRFATPSPVTWLSCFKLEVSMVSCGKYHTAALTNNGIYTWGCSKYGQLGLGQVYESPHPRLVSALANENVISLCCGQYHTLALSSQGSVFSWGWGVHGQLGLGSVDDQRYPKYVEELKEHVIVDIKAGHGHSLVLSDKGHVYSFGSGIFGQLGTSNTLKKSLPVLVRGISGKVVCIATGYFHSLALTESNALYTWGASPQCLRLLAHARKRSRLLQCENSVNTSDLDSSKSSTEECLERFSEPELSKANAATDKTESEEHLSPSLVDTSNVTGKITQISCGCHHSALITDSGGLYTWGRSIDGQLGNGGHREISLPTQINVNSFKVDCVSCGCEFTTAQDRHTGKIYSWGSNSIGQLAIPVKESATKSLDGKLVMLKSCKRIVRLLDRNTGSNSFDTPKEVPDIPPPTFTYHTLNRHITSSARNLLSFDQKYCHRRLHFIIETFSHIINLPFLLDKSLECGNYQAASKILMLENKCKKSIVYQLKALQSLPKYHSNSYIDNNITEKENTKAGKPSRSSKSSSLKQCGGPDPNKVEYMQHARYILETYIDLNSVKKYESYDIGTILEVGIQFWMAEKLPMTILESFLLAKLDDLFYDFGFMLFCQQEKDDQLHYLKEFSSRFLFMVVYKILIHIENDESCIEYLEAMLKILMSNKTVGKIELSKKVRAFKKKKPKSETYVDAVKESLRQQWSNEDFIKVSYEDLIRDNVYFFSCGHYHSSETLNEEFKLFEEIGDEVLMKKLKEFYEIIKQTCRSDLACPLCVRNYVRK